MTMGKEIEGKNKGYGQVDVSINQKTYD